MQVLARILCAVFCLSIVFYLAHCSPSTSYETGTDNSELEKLLALTPRADAEAEEAAIWLSGELLAPESLYQSISGDLKLLRSQFEPELDGMEFFGSVSYNQITIGLSEDYKALIREGRYHYWDELNDLFGVIEIDTGYFAHNYRHGYVHLSFESRVNPFKIAEYYDTLPGVSSVNLRHHLFYTGEPFMLPWIVDGEIAFIWRGYNEECQDGHFNLKYKYFMKKDGIYYKVGEYDYCDETYPPWWDIAMCAVASFKKARVQDCH